MDKKGKKNAAQPPTAPLAVNAPARSESITSSSSSLGSSPIGGILAGGIRAPFNTPSQHSATAAQSVAIGELMRTLPPASLDSDGDDAFQVQQVQEGGFEASLKERLSQLALQQEGDVGEEGEEDEEEEDEALKQFVAQLQELHGELQASELEYLLGVKKLEEKLLQKRAVVFEKRKAIIAAAAQIKTVVDAATGEEIEEIDGGNRNGIRDFWLAAMANHPILSEMIQEHDVEALNYLDDIEAVQLPESGETFEKDKHCPFGFELRFHFRPNPFFSNTVLSRSFRSPNLYKLGMNRIPHVAHTTTTDIQWKSNDSNLIAVGEKKYQMMMGMGLSPVPSFFCFFSAEYIDQLKNLSVLPEEGEEAEAEAAKSRAESDLRIASVLYFSIIPEAVTWFDGSAELDYALDDEDDEYDDEDDEDDEDDDDAEDGEEEEDDDEEDEEDEEEEEEEQQRPQNRGGRRGKRGGRGGANDQECKQQ